MLSPGVHLVSLGSLVSHPGEKTRLGDEYNYCDHFRDEDPGTEAREVYYLVQEQGPLLYTPTAPCPFPSHTVLQADDYLPLSSTRWE